MGTTHRNLYIRNDCTHTRLNLKNSLVRMSKRSCWLISRLSKALTHMSPARGQEQEQEKLANKRGRLRQLDPDKHQLSTRTSEGPEKERRRFTELYYWSRNNNITAENNTWQRGTTQKQKFQGYTKITTPKADIVHTTGNTNRTKVSPPSVRRSSGGARSEDAPMLQRAISQYASRE